MKNTFIVLVLIVYSASVMAQFKWYEPPCPNCGNNNGPYYIKDPNRSFSLHCICNPNRNQGHHPRDLECLKPVRSGNGKCKAYSTRYFYNEITKRCESFMYSGCNDHAKDAVNNYCNKNSKLSCTS